MSLVASRDSDVIDNLDVYLSVNNASVTRAISSFSRDGLYVQGGCQAVLTLTPGQVVHVLNSYPGSRYNYGTSFSGALLHAHAP